MSDFDEEKRLKRCLEENINVVQETITRLKPQDQLDQDASLTNPGLDINIYSFTLNAAEEASMRNFKTDLENVVNKHLPHLSKASRRYLLDFLQQYDYNYETREFTNPFNIGILDSFAHDLRSTLASINAFRAAWDGDQEKVQTFIKNYPTVKDKSGLWGITLLYSAARNNHLNLVKYLVAKAKCSVNAQNQQHIMRALSASTITDDDYEVNPTAGSTALHGACFHGKLEIVKYLVEHGADYFITNHVDETPIMNADGRPAIIKYFRELLILGYSSEPTVLPNKPILEEQQPHSVDCVWEYKPMADREWFPFSDFESVDLQKALIIIPNQKFEREIHLKVRSGIYSVSMMKFLRSGKDLDYNQKLAWVRCRGSSVLNFDCCVLWQIMFTTHPEAASDSTLEMISIPVIHDSRFKMHLNSWYFVDARTNNQLDQTMKYRRRHINLDLPLISPDILTFDLQAFSVSNKEKTINGFIRWIPKMVSNNSGHKDKIISVDQYGTLANIDPLPLTTSRLKQVSQTTDNTSVVGDEELAENIDDDDDDDSAFETMSSITDDATIDTSDKVQFLFACYLKQIYLVAHLVIKFPVTARRSQIRSRLTDSRASHCYTGHHARTELSG